MLLAERSACLVAESDARERALLIEKLKHTIARLRHERFGPSAERGALLDQLELQLFELEEDVAQAETAVQAGRRPGDGDGIRALQAGASAASRTPTARARGLSRAVSLPMLRRRTAQAGRGPDRDAGVVPRQWKVIQHVRERFSCHTCEAITQPPAPSHPIAPGRAGPGLLAHVLFAKYGLHLPLNRQSATYARDGVDLDVSSLADGSALRQRP